MSSSYVTTSLMLTTCNISTVGLGSGKVVLNGSLPFKLVKYVVKGGKITPVVYYPKLKFYYVDVTKICKYTDGYYEVAIIDVAVQNVEPYSGKGFVRIYNMCKVPIIISVWGQKVHVLPPGAYYQDEFNIAPLEEKLVDRFFIFLYPEELSKIDKVVVKLAVGHIEE